MRICRTLAVILIAASVLRGVAAEPEASTRVDAPAAGELTLETAITRAHQMNETREVAAARLQHALALRRVAIASLIPSLSASASTSKSWISNQPFGGGASEANDLSVGVSLTLFNAGDYSAIKSATASLRAQELDSAELRRTLTFQVAIGFLNVIAIEHQLQAAEKRQSVAAQTAEQIRARVKAGVATPNDATRSDLELATAALTVTNDRQAVLAARLSLGDLINAEVTGPLKDPEPAVLPSRVLAELEGLALRERPDLRSGELRIHAIELQAQSVRRGIIPTVGVSGSWSLRDTDPEPATKISPDWQVALFANWTIYDGGNREATATAFDADRRESVANLSSVRRGLHRDLATAVGALTTAEATVTQAETQLKVANLNLDEVQARFKQGLATALDAADANASVFQAESDLANRRLDLGSSRFQLRQLLGRWPLADVPPADAVEKPGK